jgi:glycosyltransferase involved in cell wall biosynthesis
MSDPLISIIMPAYNAASFLKEAVKSVLAQDYPHWELLIVNDGSTDATAQIAKSFTDTRIRYFSQPNAGVSAARNCGLSTMKGDYFCFLDADDVMPPQSLSSRLSVFTAHADCAFAGGAQEQRNEDLSRVLKTQLPSYNGWPRAGLVALDPNCFVNCGTWLIKRAPGRTYAFPVGMTHAEDIAFFLSISDQGALNTTPAIAQIYRRHASAMSNLDGLWNGYLHFYAFAAKGGYLHSRDEQQFLQKKIRSIMVKSFLRGGHPLKAWRVMTHSFYA